MKQTKKSSLIYALFFLFIGTGIHAQKFDFDEFHIPEDLNLNDSEYDRFQNIGKQLKEKLVADLIAQGYDVISPRKSKLELERVGLDDLRIDYDPEADRVIFGKLLIAGNYITINTYLYGSENGIRRSHQPLINTTLSRRSYELNTPEEINVTVSEIIAGLSLNKPEPPKADTAPTPPVKSVVDPEPKSPVTPEIPETKPPEPPKTPKDKVCSKAPGAVLVVAGGLMGGTGFYLRSRAVKIYDEEYRELVGFAGDKDKLEEARKPNRMAHIIGAGGILTAGVGAFLWAKCGKKQKKKKNSVGIEHFQITPHVEYNTMTNTNNVTARISFNF